jgi:hypothetical protein
MPTPAELKAIVLALPADHPARLAWDRRDTTDTAAALSALTLPGRVPTSEILTYLFDSGVYGKARVVVGLPVPGDSPGQQLYGLCATITELRLLEQVNVRADAFRAALVTLVALTWIDQPLADEITALAENREPVVACSNADVAAAMEVK